MEVEFSLDGEQVRSPPGLSVAAALLRLGRPVLRRTTQHSRPRSLFCGMGACHDCLMRIDGRHNVRACVTPVREGMCVETGSGDATLDRRE